MLLTTGNTADITVTKELISQIDFKGSTILADRAYGKWEFREYIAITTPKRAAKPWTPREAARVSAHHSAE